MRDDQGRGKHDIAGARSGIASIDVDARKTEPTSRVREERPAGFGH